MAQLIKLILNLLQLVTVFFLVGQMTFITLARFPQLKVGTSMLCYIRLFVCCPQAYLPLNLFLVFPSLFTSFSH